MRIDRDALVLICREGCPNWDSTGETGVPVAPWGQPRANRSARLRQRQPRDVGRQGGFRADPEYRAQPNTGSKETPSMQVVMPTIGFVAMVALFERTVQRLIAQKMITEAEVAAIRSIQGSKSQ